MTRKSILLILLAMLLFGCSLAEDVTPPPPLATAQAAPIQQETPPVRATAQAGGEEPSGSNEPSSAPSIFNGAMIYLESCEPCHGPIGLGDGSMSANLEVPIPALGDFELAREIMPADWYEVVTNGRMENFMPPFTSLSDAQRWDVVAYALSLGYPPETREAGSDLYIGLCADCHGESGEGGQAGPSLISPENFAGYSVDAIAAVIAGGQGEMPAIGADLAPYDLGILAAYVQSLGTVVHGAAAGMPVPEQPLEISASTGTISGVVVNGTSGAALPEGLEVTIVGLEGGMPVFEQAQPLEADGSFSMTGLELAPGRIYGALVDFDDVVYYSIAGHLLEETPELDLPITIYETTPDESGLIVERLHVIFDFSIEGLVEISELWLITSSGDRTVVQRGGQNAIPVTLPDGFSNLRFDEVAPELYTVTGEGFVIHEPIRPDEPLEVVVSFTLPYDRSLDFDQALDMPVQAVILLAESDGPTIEGEGLQDLGVRDMGGLVLRNYAMGAMDAGDRLSLTLRGRHPSARSDSSTSNLMIGVVVFVVVLASVGLGLWLWQRRSDVSLDQAQAERVGARSRGDLLQAIARLDDDFEAGELAQDEYEQKRAALKTQLLELMPGDD